MDGNLFFSFANENKGYEYWPFDNKMFLILNIAVGGSFGGQKGIGGKSIADGKWKLTMLELIKKIH